MGKPTTRVPLAERLAPWGVGVLESHHAPGFVMAPRRHPFVKVLYAIDGAGSLCVEGLEWSFAAGDLMVVPPGRRNRLVDDSRRPASLYVLCVARGVLRFDPTLVERLPVGRLPPSMAVADRAGGLFRRLCFEQTRGGEGAPLAMVAAALEVIHLAVASASAPSSAAAGERNARQEVRRYAQSLGDRFYEREPIDAVARRLGLSRRRFTTLFREVTGESWLVHTRRLAIDHASRLLAETDAPIAAVAFECGFGDLSSFYRRFKALRGTPPAEWRRRHRAGASPD
ncbi:MAG: AraC family transcriptional regulator [Planctomycetota bacterium]